MNEKIKKLAKQLVDFWKALDKKKKIIISSAAAAVVIVVIAVVSVLNTTKYELLCSGLSDEEVGQIYSTISAKGIPVKVSGDSIYVKEGTASSLLMELAEEGIPDTNLSYDLYSSGSNYAETDKDKELKQLRQTQDRLQDAIKTIPGIKNAIITIADGNEDTYVLETDKQPTKASVKLTLKSGTTLTKKQVNGIVNLVANSVPGLIAENVTVVDSEGNVLNGDVTAEEETAQQLIMKNKYEANVKEKLVAMLEQVYGESNVNVVVNADIDFSSVSTVTNSYTSGVVNYVSEGSEVTSTGSSSAAGTTGVNGAQPTYADSSGTGSTNYTSKTSKTTSMLVGSVQEAIQKVGGKVNRLTVAVVLNSYSPTAANTDVEELRKTIANAAGTTVDNVSVQQVAFSSAVPSSSSSPAAAWTLPDLKSGILYIIIAVVMLLVALLSLLLVLLRQRKKKREMEMQQALEAAQQAEEAQKQAEEAKAAAPTIKSIEETIAETEKNSYKREIEKFTDQKPELVAQILKNWLKD